MGYSPQTWVDDGPGTPGTTIDKSHLDHIENGIAQVSQAWRFYVEDYGAVGDGTTDDTTAIKNALAAAVTYATGSSNHYVELIFQAKTYALSGATVQGGSTKGNAQIPLPYIVGTAPKITIVLKGFSEPTNNHWNTTSPQIMGTVLKSTLTGQAYSSTYGMPSIIGGPTPEASGFGVAGTPGGPGSFTNVCAVVDGIQLLAPVDPTLHGFDFRVTAEAHIVKASALGSSLPSAMPTLTAFTSGLLMPLGANNDFCEIGQWTCAFWYCGVSISEHTNAVSIRSIGCAIGIRAIGMASHAAVIQRANCESCHTAVLQYVLQNPSVYTTGGIRIRIMQLDVEDVGSTVIDDASNNLFGEVYYTNQFNGITTSAVNGAGNLRIIDMDRGRGSQTAPAMPASTVTLVNPFWRDAVVTITGGTVTAVAVQGQTTGLTSGNFIVGTGGGIAITYSAAPTWKWSLL